MTNRVTNWMLGGIAAAFWLIALRVWLPGSPARADTLGLQASQLVVGEGPLYILKNNKVYVYYISTGLNDPLPKTKFKLLTIQDIP